ncbi:MAG: enoyl-CoA hydratase-related protein [Pseudomonadota bacterium]
MGWDFETIRVSPAVPVARVTLSRPDVRNAFNDVMIRELREAFRSLRALDGLRAAVLTGEGSSFCAGADLHWMGRVVDYTKEESYADSLALAELLNEMYEFPVPLVGRINGPAIGGGVGFVAVCDVSVAAGDAVFGFSEVKIGLVPACISPYVLKRVGERYAREYFMTGERLSAHQARECGLINRVADAEGLDAAVDGYLKTFLEGAPQALAMCKRMLGQMAEMPLKKAVTETARMITDLRCGSEGQEGMRSFLQKRKPSWRA